jgi:hypothetical protein
MQKISWKCGCCNEIQTSEKEYKTFPYKINQMSISCKNKKVTNHFSGQSAEVTPLEEAVYSMIMGVQIFAGKSYMTNPKAQKVVRAGLDWFREYHAANYMTLLD